MSDVSWQIVDKCLRIAFCLQFCSWA